MDEEKNEKIWIRLEKDAVLNAKVLGKLFEKVTNKLTERKVKKLIFCRGRLKGHYFFKS